MKYKVVRYWKDKPPTVITLDEADVPWSLHIEELKDPNMIEMKITKIKGKKGEDE